MKLKIKARVEADHIKAIQEEEDTKEAAQLAAAAEAAVELIEIEVSVNN